MAERDVEVCAVSPGELRLRLLGSACEGCLGGCGGRCNVFAPDAQGEVRVPAPPGRAPDLGQRLRLQLDDASLRRLAWRGYGLAWLGLVIGAGAGRALSVFWPTQADLSTLAGLLLGTFLAVRFSKRPIPDTRLVPCSQPSSPLEHE